LNVLRVLSGNGCVELDCGINRDVGCWERGHDNLGDGYQIEPG
jgi:hypothetical protein